MTEERRKDGGRELHHDAVHCAWTEPERLAALHRYAILDTSPEQAFDDIVQLTAQLLEVPIVAVNLIDAGRQWFKSEVGLGVREMPLDDSICKFALLENDRMVVPDTTLDPRFVCNPLVTGGPGLRFYAGEVLKTADGLPLGTLCILDTTARPQGLTALQALTLRTMAQQVWSQLELRRIVHEQQQALVEQARMQGALQRAQERIRLATDAAGLGLWSWDSGTDLVTWENARPSAILGLAAGSTIDARQFLIQHVHPDDAATFTTVVADALRSGAQFHVELRLVRADGSLRWAEFHGQAQPMTNGMAPFVLGVVADITARKLAAMDLYESRARFENIISQAATGVVQTDTAGMITLVNQKFCTMLGYDESEMLTRSVRDITAPESIQPTLDALHQVSTGGVGVVVQKQYRRKDGTLMWANSSVSALRDASGRYTGMVAIVVDITESRQAEHSLRKVAADLAEADRRKSEFLATLAHELRNPLAPISSGLSLLRLGSDSPATVARIRQMMERQVGQMVRLIDDLLDVARISGGKIHLNPARIDVQAVIDSAIETSQPYIDAGAHQLTVTYPAPPLQLEADATRIAQVLSNLLNNAAKYTPTGGRIDITAQRDGEHVVIRVSDDGVGIPAESLGSIFEMFSQVRHTINRAQGGLGVGLSLVRRLVEMHGGSTSAASDGAGKGTVVTVRLPLAGSEALPGSHVSGPDLAQPQRNLRLLVADDNADAAETLAAMLALQGHTLRVAHNGADAVRIARSFLPEVSFLDIGMPDMNGYDTAAALRQIAGLEAMVLVALTGWGDANDRARSRQAGFHHHLTKPADLATINALLTQVALPLES